MSMISKSKRICTLLRVCSVRAQEKKHMLPATRIFENHQDLWPTHNTQHTTNSTELKKSNLKTENVRFVSL